MEDIKLRDGFKYSRFLPVEIDGVTKTLGDWAKCFGIKESVMKIRYKRGDRGARLIRNARHYKGVEV